LHYYNFHEDDQEEDKDKKNVQITETKGEHAIEVPQHEYVMYAKPLRMHRVNIGTSDNLMFANIGDYWNDETI